MYTEEITLVARKADMCFFMLESFVDISVEETHTELESITTKAFSTVSGEQSVLVNARNS